MTPYQSSEICILYFSRIIAIIAIIAVELFMEYWISATQPVSAISIYQFNLCMFGKLWLPRFP